MLRTISLAPATVEIITLACIALHNFLAVENWKSYTDLNEANNEIDLLRSIGKQGSNRSTITAVEVREEFKKHFNSSEGAVEWQENAILRHNM